MNKRFRTIDFVNFAGDLCRIYRALTKYEESLEAGMLRMHQTTESMPYSSLDSRIPQIAIVSWYPLFVV